jgi:hypothetical protein
VPISSEDQWEKYVKIVMKSDFQCLDLVVRKLSKDPTPLGHSPLIGHSPPHGFSPALDVLGPCDPPLSNREVDEENVFVVPDVQSAPNEVGVYPNVDAPNVVTDPQEIPLTQNHLSKCCSYTFHSLNRHYLHSLVPNDGILICCSIVGDIPGNVGCPPVPPSATTVPIGLASNSADVDIDDDEEPYGTTRAVHSDDDRPIAALSQEEIELIRIFCPDHDPLVHKFSDLSHSHGAYAEGRDDELLEAPEAGDSMEIRRGLIYKDLPTLRRWL